MPKVGADITGFTPHIPGWQIHCLSCLNAVCSCAVQSVDTNPLFSALRVYPVSARYVSAKAKGRADLDWSAIGMDISETAGIDVSKDVARNIQDVKDGRTY